MLTYIAYADNFHLIAVKLFFIRLIFSPSRSIHTGRHPQPKYTLLSASGWTLKSKGIFPNSCAAWIRTVVLPHGFCCRALAWAAWQYKNRVSTCSAAVNSSCVKTGSEFLREPFLHFVWKMPRSKRMQCASFGARPKCLGNPMCVCCAVHLERDVLQIFYLSMSQWSRGADPEICSSPSCICCDPQHEQGPENQAE